MSVLKAGVIGLGVGERHIESYESDPRCQVVAICDIDEAKLADVHSRYPDTRATVQATDILDDPEIDVVSIASYDNYHCEQVVKALGQNKHVFVEKPLCLTEEELRQIHEAMIAQPHLHLSSNLVLRRAPQFEQLKPMIREGAFGQLYYLEGDYNYGRLHKITSGWRGEIPFYSVTHGGAIHLIDLLTWLAAEKVIEVTAVGNKISTKDTQFRFPDMVSALLRFDSGMTAKVTANFGSVCPHHHGLKVFGTEKYFEHTYQGGTFYDSRDRDATFECSNLGYHRQKRETFNVVLYPKY